MAGRLAQSKLRIGVLALPSAHSKVTYIARGEVAEPASHGWGIKVTAREIFAAEYAGCLRNSACLVLSTKRR